MSDLAKFTDFLTVPATILVLFLWMSIDRAYLPLVLTGVATWTLIEYWAHRAMHQWVLRAAHMRHHQHPRHLVGGTLYTTLLMAALVVLGRSAPGLAPCLQGLLLGYLAYTTIHTLNHHTTWASRWMPRLMRNHDVHHQGPAHRRFGVTITVWDRVFGTL